MRRLQTVRERAGFEPAALLAMQMMNLDPSRPYLLDRAAYDVGRFIG